MTTPPRLLINRVGNGPILIQRQDKSTYAESDRDAVLMLIRAECVEGVGPRSGRIAFLRMVVPPVRTAAHIQAVSDTPPVKQKRCPLTSDASREIFPQLVKNKTGKGVNVVWCHKLNSKLSLSGVISLAKPIEFRKLVIPLRAAA